MKKRENINKSNNSPTKSNNSPTKSNNSPTKSNISPTKSNISPTKSNISPTKSNISPTKYNISPTKYNISPTNFNSDNIFSFMNNIHYINYIKCSKEQCYNFLKNNMKKYKTFLIKLLKFVETYYNVDNNKFNNKNFINILFKMFFKLIKDLLDYNFYNCILKNCNSEYISFILKYKNLDFNNISDFFHKIKNMFLENKDFINMIFGTDIINELNDFIDIQYYALNNKNITKKEFNKLKEIYLFLIKTLYDKNKINIILYLNNNVSIDEIKNLLYKFIFGLKFIINNYDNLIKL